MKGVNKMLKISRVDAYQGMDEIDFKVMDQEMYQISNSPLCGNSETTSQFFLDEDGYIVLEMYYDKKLVHTLRFENKGELTEQGKKAVGRPSLGTTKKVSLTLQDEVWGKIEEIKEEEDISQSAVLRYIVEKYYNPTNDTVGPEEKERRYDEFKEFVFNTDVTKLTFHIYQHGLIILSPVEKVEPYYDDDGIKITFQGGNCHIWATNLISKCDRPDNLIIKCEACYLLYNEYDEPIGYVYTKK